MKPVIDLINNRGMYIINEGNFQFGNASISYYNPADKSMIEDIFKYSNNQSLGDVCQSMSLINGWYYIVVNNSQKIEIVNPENFQKKTSITGLISPRYILQVSNSKAYVSDFKSHRVSIINLHNHTKMGEIPIRGWTEQMHLIYGKVFITNMQTNRLYIVNSANDVIEDSLQLTKNPGSIVEDKNGKLWVLCEGDASIQQPGALLCIDPGSKNIIKEFTFNLPDAPKRLSINDTHDTLYYINKHIYQLATDANALPSAALISGNNKNFYDISIEPKTGNLFAADAIDYIQKGKIYAYNSKGLLIADFKVGIIPSKTYFK
jgi:DNA-binding beta-propeller fold protein YncE